VSICSGKSNECCSWVGLHNLICVRARVSYLISITNMAAWRNGIASDYESGDCRFDPCGGHLYFIFCFVASPVTKRFP
jgi:hypothetical protein